jgi:hypothetical protein
MGKSTTPKHAVHFVTNNGFWTPMAWRRVPCGNPTQANLALFVAELEKATLPGGTNAHLGPTKILSAKIVQNHAGGAEVATYRDSDPRRF